MPKKRQALVEYEDMNGSSTAVTYAADNQVYIAGHPAFINYSTSQKISRPGDSDDSRSVNNVLLLTIMNPIYPITTVKDVFSPSWNLACIFKFVCAGLWQNCVVCNVVLKTCRIVRIASFSFLVYLPHIYSVCTILDHLEI